MGEAERTGGAERAGGAGGTEGVEKVRKAGVAGGTGEADGAEGGGGAGKGTRSDPCREAGDRESGRNPEGRELVVYEG